MNRITCILGFGLVTLAACSSNPSEESQTPPTGSSSSSTSSGTGGAQSTDPPGPPGCARGAIEADFHVAGPLAGPGVDANGQLLPLPEGAIASTTYLALRSEAASQRQFGEL